MLEGEKDTIFTPFSALSLALVLLLGFIGYFAALQLLPKSQSSSRNRFVFTWLVFDGLLHFSFEGAFLYTSTFGRTAFNSSGFAATLWREYAKADYRWGISDPTVVSLEILTVFICGSLCFLIAKDMIYKQERARHFWTIVLSTMELYGGWMTFCPEWLTGSPNLRTDNPFHLWVYLAFLNGVWVAIPLYLLIDSYRALVWANIPVVRIHAPGSPSSPGTPKKSLKKRQ